MASLNRLNPSQRLKRITGWLARPRTARVVGPGGLVVGLVILTAGLFSIFHSGGQQGPDGEALTSGGTAFSVPGGPSGEGVWGTSHLVPPLQASAGFRMIIDEIGVNAEVVKLGLDEDQVPQVPSNGGSIAWFDFSARPGEGGNAVFTGHVSWERTPAVFFDLEDLHEGEIILLKWNDGREMAYEVFDNFLVDPKDPDSLKVMAPAPRDMLTLITCGGTWVNNPAEPFRGHFTKRVIIQARQVEPSLGLLIPEPLGDS